METLRASRNFRQVLKTNTNIEGGMQDEDFILVVADIN